jgi:hypothetical protein
MIGGSNKMLSMHQAAEYCGMTYKHYAANYIPLGIPYHKIGRSVKFRVRDLEWWLAARRHVPTELTLF